MKYFPLLCLEHARFLTPKKSSSLTEESIKSTSCHLLRACNLLGSGISSCDKIAPSSEMQDLKHQLIANQILLYAQLVESDNSFSSSLRATVELLEESSVIRANQLNLSDLMSFANSSSPFLSKQEVPCQKNQKPKKPKEKKASSLVDPERWLPKYERQAYKKKQNNNLRGAQGSSSEEKKVSSSAPSSASIAVTPADTQKPNNKKKNKKKK